MFFPDDIRGWKELFSNYNRQTPFWQLKELKWISQ